MDAGENTGCFACGVANPIGLGLAFGREAEAVETVFTPLQWHQGYDGLVHGGITTTLLDEAMAHALLARGIRAVTARLAVRFSAPLEVGATAIVRGKITADRGRLVEAAAEIRTGGALIASAEGVFAVQDRED